MAISVHVNPARLTWGLFRPVDSIPDDSEDAQIAPIATGLENFHPQRLRNGNFKIPDLTITVSLDRSNTLVLHTADKTPELLSHEQRHLDLLVLVTRALARELEPIEAMSVSELATQLQAVKDRHAANAEAIDKAYDTQTDHSRNRAAQARWDSAIAQAMGSDNATQVLTMAL